MDLNEKLQALRKQRGLTQEELAKALFVSRTAVSKWESGRGYPSIDSLKALADFFSVTVDDLLLSGDALPVPAEKPLPQHDLPFALPDLFIALLLLLPVFGQKSAGMIQAVSILSLRTAAPWLKAVYWGLAALALASGLLGLFPAKKKTVSGRKPRRRLSLLCNALGAALFILGTQPYAACLWCVALAIKLFFLFKRR